MLCIHSGFPATFLFRNACLLYLAPKPGHDVDLAISDSDLVVMGSVTFKSQGLSSTVLEIFMSLLFDIRILFDVQRMLVYGLMGCNIYLQIMLRRTDKVICDLPNNINPLAPFKTTPPK